MSRLDPKNREEAYAHQFQDDAKVLKAASLIGEHEFRHALSTLETHIWSYRAGITLKKNK